MVSGGQTLTLGCVVIDGGDVCRAFAYGETAQIHLERDGFTAFDTTGVRSNMYDGCPRPPKELEVEMVQAE